jgi:hypothetical protein
LKDLEDKFRGIEEANPDWMRNPIVMPLLTELYKKSNFLLVGKKKHAT